MSRHDRDDEHKDENPKIDVSKFDQSMSMLGDYLPGLWWRMYHNMRMYGFTEEQAMSLLRSYVKTAYLPTEVKE